ncbi:MAG TPA: sigma-70 family RNA polymerase sigma factor [Pyrinomonadaceae bacterium]|nr:sigma-70 family RNA polymerase sigma factor [Pyrinomonadaceae bacterium]
MKKNWTITPDSFSKLLLWLDEDIDQAGLKYQQIREKLIRIFISRGFSDSEDLADEVFNRVISKIDPISEKYQGEKSLYFFGIASKIILEANRKRELHIDESITKAFNNEYRIDPKLECLDNCLRELPPEQRTLILSYYQVDKTDKVLIRAELAKRFDLNISTLRVQISRIRKTLKSCIEDCSGKD